MEQRNDEGEQQQSGCEGTYQPADISSQPGSMMLATRQ